MESKALPLKRPRKRWLSSELRITVRLFLCFAMFFSIIDRWISVTDHMENISNSSNFSPEYAKEIDVQIHLMTQSQLEQLFQKEPPNELVEWKPGQTQILNDPSPLYLVIRLLNRGDKYAWGKLQAQSKDWYKGLGIDTRIIPVPYLPPKMGDYKTFVLASAAGIGSFEPWSSEVVKSKSDISTTWILLYSSLEEPKNG